MREFATRISLGVGEADRVLLTQRLHPLDTKFVGQIARMTFASDTDRPISVKQVTRDVSTVLINHQVQLCLTVVHEGS
jgi:hypothetical protein